MKKKGSKKAIRHSNNKKNARENIKKGLKRKFKSNSSRISRKIENQLSLKERMMQKLKSSKFRYMNEELYTMKGKQAMQYFKNDSGAFKDYHVGYQQQVEKWPINPLDVVIKSLDNSFPDGTVIADFGCGTARLAESLPQFTVHSFDLVALSPRVTVCDVANTPLSNNSVDIVVCCLSLMGTNLTDYVREANRILKNGGLFKVAEVESRFEDVEGFLQNITNFGFKIVKTDLEYDLFYFMEFTKNRDLGKRAKKKLPDLILKPCLYKKR